MPLAKLSNLHIEYQLFGNKDRPVLLLINGLSNQLIDWPDTLINKLSEEFHVVIFDNRDSGLSSQTPVNLYNLYNLAQDSLELMNHLSIEKFHVLGFSMGGMIAQLLAIDHPSRIQTLTSLMSSDGYQQFDSAPEAQNSLEASSQRTTDLNALAKEWLTYSKSYQGSIIKENIEILTSGIQAALERSYCPEGIQRQLTAIATTPTRDLSHIKCPSLIIHGEDDPCILVKHAKNAHSLVNQSKLIIYPGLGHELPLKLIPDLTDKIISFINS